MIQPSFTLKIDVQENSFGKFVYEPLNTSFGNSMGNAIRRTLLSSLPGSAITHVQFEEAPHMFTTIKGVKESVLDIVLNLKQVRFEQEKHGKLSAKITIKGAKKVYASDIEGEVSVVNKDLYIAEITDPKAELNINLLVQYGYGYEPADEKEAETGFIAIDSSYSPVTKVNFKVEEARVGRKTDFERLILEVSTDGSISPLDAVKKASAILASHFNLVFEGKEKEQIIATVDDKKIADDTKSPAYETIIDELNLPSRVINALLRENIETVSDLVDRGREELTNLKGVGKKSIDLIVDEVGKMGVELK